VTELQQAGKEFAAIVHLPFGAMGVGTAGGVVTEMFYLPADTPQQAPANALAEKAVQQLLAYCADADYVFDLPLAMRGSEFQRRVWQTLREIPRGQVRTYGELAKHLDSVARAVGLPQQSLPAAGAVPPRDGRQQPGRLCRQRRPERLHAGRQALAAGARRT
jgi:methylated-DNA-[protein]-cysteine S-methyltransferase